MNKTIKNNIGFTARVLYNMFYIFTCVWLYINHISFLNLSFLNFEHEIIKLDCGVQCLYSTHMSQDHFLKNIVLIYPSLPNSSFSVFLLPTAKDCLWAIDTVFLCYYSVLFVCLFLPESGRRQLPRQLHSPWRCLANV